MADNELRSLKLEDVGYVYIGICKGRDVWKNRHEDDFFCIIETKDGKSIDVVRDLVGEAIGFGYAYCAMVNQGIDYPDETEDMSECPYRDEKGICRPRLFKFKISIEAMPLEERYPCCEKESEQCAVSKESRVKETAEKPSGTHATEKTAALPAVHDTKALVENLSSLILGLEGVTCQAFRQYVCFYKGKPSLQLFSPSY
jgi:hypothetical protein